MKKRISLILVFCLFVGTFALSPVTAEAATNKPSYDTEKYIKEAISAKLFPSSIGSRPYTDYMTNQEACTTLLQLYTFLGGAAVTVPAVHPFTNTQDADVEKAYELGLIPPSAYSAYYDDGEEEGEGGGYYYDTDEETDPFAFMYSVAKVIVAIKPAAWLTESAALTKLKVHYSYADSIQSEYLPAIAFLDAQGLFDYTKYWYYGLTREDAFVIGTDVAWKYQKAKMLPYLIKLQKPVTYYTQGYTYYKNNVDLYWESPDGAQTFNIAIYTSKNKKQYSATLNSTYLYIGKKGKPTYKSVFGNNKKKISEYVKITPVDRHGNVSPNTLKFKFYVDKFTSVNQKLFGSNSFGFKSTKAAKKFQKTVKVKVWKVNNKGKKYSSTASIRVNKNLASDVKKIFKEIYKGKEKFPIYAVGGFAVRASKTSEHNYGSAIDINPNENYMVQGKKALVGSFWNPKKSKYSIKKNGDVVKAFNKYGWYWGGLGWGNKKDYMHFSYLGT